MNKKNKIINKFIILFVIIVILCTYFSKTIKNALLPEVTVVTLNSKTIGNNYETEGTINYTDTHKIYAMHNWNVKDILVKLNQHVEKGTVLGDVDNDAITLSEREEEATIMQLQDEIQALKSSPNPDQNKIKEDQYNLDTDNLKYGQIRKGLTSTGGILSDTEGTVVAINAQTAQAGGTDDSSDTQSTDSSGGSNNALFEIVNNKPSFVVNWTTTSNDAKNFFIGSKIHATKSSDANSNSTITQLTGQVIKKQYDDKTNQYDFSASIDGSPSINEDDNVTVSSIESSKRYNNVIPKSCLTEQDGLDYIFIVNQKSQALGTEMYVQKVQVQVVASDDVNCSIKPFNGSTIPSNLGIVMSTTKSIDDNSEVKLDNDENESR